MVGCQEKKKCNVQRRMLSGMTWRSDGLYPQKKSHSPKDGWLREGMRFRGRSKSKRNQGTSIHFPRTSLACLIRHSTERSKSSKNSTQLHIWPKARWGTQQNITEPMLIKCWTSPNQKLRDCQERRGLPWRLSLTMQTLQAITEGKRRYTLNFNRHRCI